MKLYKTLLATAATCSLSSISPKVRPGEAPECILDLSREGQLHVESRIENPQNQMLQAQNPQPLILGKVS